jgi:hypothetical protein
MYPSAVIKQSEINAAVSQIAGILAPDVVYIRYDIGQDWSGDAARFRRISPSGTGC